MNLALKRMKVYLQLVVFVALVGLVMLVLFKNRNNGAHVWFFGLTDSTKPMNVVWLLGFTASTTLIVARIFWFMRGMFRDMRDLKHKEEATRAAKEQLQREAQLKDRMHRVEEQLRDADKKTGEDGD